MILEHFLSIKEPLLCPYDMLELVKGSHKRTWLTETVLVISIFVCTNITL